MSLKIDNAQQESLWQFRKTNDHDMFDGFGINIFINNISLKANRPEQNLKDILERLLILKIEQYQRANKLIL